MRIGVIEKIARAYYFQLALKLVRLTIHEHLPGIVSIQNNFSSLKTHVIYYDCIVKFRFSLKLVDCLFT